MAFGENAHFGDHVNQVVMVILLVAILANSVTADNELEMNRSTFGSCRN